MARLRLLGRDRPSAEPDSSEPDFAYAEVELTERERAAAVLRQLELDVKRRIDGMLHGDYLGLVPGHGSELGETRGYVPGDDVRRIDWNVTARLQEPFVRQTIADHELETRVLIDQSPSMDFGTADCEKRDLALRALGAVGFLTNRVGNRFGAELVSPTGTELIPPRQGRDHVMAILDRVQRHPRMEGTTELAPAILRLDAAAQRPGIRVVISDFLHDDDWGMALRRIGTRHDTLCIEIVDPRELSLPDIGPVAFIDPSTGRVKQVRTSDKALRQRFDEAAAEQREQIADTIRQAGADHLILRTDRDWLFDIVRFVSKRRQHPQGATQ